MKDGRCLLMAQVGNAALLQQWLLSLWKAAAFVFLEDVAWLSGQLILGASVCCWPVF